MLSSSFSAFASTNSNIHPLQPINLEVNAPQASVYNNQSTNQPDILVRINGWILPKSADTGFPVIHNDRTFVPLRLVTEGMGLDVDWFSDTRDIHLTGVDDVGSVWHRVGSLTATSSRGGGTALADIDVASHIDTANNRTMVSIRLLSEALGADVTWLPNQVVRGNTVNIVDIQVPFQIWSTAEDFYDIVERHSDGTLTVRTDTGELVRIALDRETGRLHPRDIDGEVTGTRFNIRLETLFHGDPRENNFVRDANAVDSGMTDDGRRDVSVMQSNINAVGAIVNVQYLDGQGNIINDIGNFMIGDDGVLSFTAIKNGQYRFTIIQAPHGFTLNQFNQNATNTDEDSNITWDVRVNNEPSLARVIRLIAE